ncbi:hypothetical protein Kpol_1033p23 [Vanderwaltozyma polyspora DSM 70294]|uniref:Long chronological lifespan protein 2 n=1 Tax=Vanderwaltozyma polyspora (strain ATCC 22028 / DSM 70294 / BCRC 21397 / CBS 2163 / NBRC 10782 / NRRL Y-8283 / UCD 57-17) TaxID=436907 RepID=LCL2_VANPO|nr:uncharacterized protein Kpol_1033p23 [Vanderwaltozyma polyspora DSM 70294]A7TJ20.1 RecName: Full=Long chronological lifespan protein 2; Flags: Precursor [Vanderwaltozyma polyspora DSM 70294]EDO17719.1 hypothetical protein Kpol_1033p23 [Vanderwaltozyma polyspora DSM 70294]
MIAGFFTRFLFAILLLLPYSQGFFNFQGNQRQQQQQHHQNANPAEGFLSPHEERALSNQCPGYLCPDTEECVDSPSSCPCPFPGSQLKCSLPDGTFVCISKPATDNEDINRKYDDLSGNSKIKFNGVRDCGWVYEMAVKGFST